MSSYVIDLSHSHAAFSVRHLMVSNVRGEFQKFSGEVSYDPANPAATTARPIRSSKRLARMPRTEDVTGAT